MPKQSDNNAVTRQEYYPPTCHMDFRPRAWAGDYTLRKHLHLVSVLFLRKFLRSD